MYGVKLLTAGSINTATLDIIPPAMASDGRPDSIEAIGERLRLLRIAYGRVQGYTREMSQVEFARLVGMSKSAWNNAETGDNRLGLDNALAVVKRIGVSLDFIYLGNDRMMPHALVTEIEKLQRSKALKRA